MFWRSSSSSLLPAVLRTQYLEANPERGWQWREKDVGTRISSWKQRLDGLASFMRPRSGGSDVCLTVRDLGILAETFGEAAWLEKRAALI